MNNQQVDQALRALGETIRAESRVKLLVVGGTAGLLAGFLPPSRTTADCDVVWPGAADEWKELERAAADIAKRLGLPSNWLNRDCEMFEWSFPLGWRGRCEFAGRYGPLEVYTVCRRDLIAIKVMGAPKRPQDLDDLRALAPTPDDLAFVGRAPGPAGGGGSGQGKVRGRTEHRASSWRCNMTGNLENTEARWARLGALFNCAPSEEPVDLERLLLDTARRCGENARLLPLAVTWLADYGHFVAKHRLKRLIGAELEAEASAVLGLILESALKHGAAPDLQVPLEACRPARPGRPLSPAYGADPALAAIAEKNASTTSRRWGVWTPEPDLKSDAVRPVQWVLAQNPNYRDRVIRKGDLRCSILETLDRDLGGRAKSESELARLCGAQRTAIRKALAALVQEGEVEVFSPNRRDHVIARRRAA